MNTTISTIPPAPTCKEGETMDEIMQEQPYKVLVRVDADGRVVEINSIKIR